MSDRARPNMPHDSSSPLPQDNRAEISRDRFPPSDSDKPSDPSSDPPYIPKTSRPKIQTSLQEQGHSDSESDLSDVPSDLSTRSPMTTPQRTRPPTQNGSRPTRQKQHKKPSIPEGYNPNTITGDLMLDPATRDHSFNFRMMHHSNADFSEGRFVDSKAYARSLRHVPPNVPKKGEAVSERKREGKSKREQAGDIDRREKMKEMLADFVKGEEQEDKGEKGEVMSRYPFREDSSWPGATSSKVAKLADFDVEADFEEMMSPSKRKRMSEARRRRRG